LTNIMAHAKRISWTAYLTGSMDLPKRIGVNGLCERRCAIVITSEFLQRLYSNLLTMGRGLPLTTNFTGA
jgi:hypothetical protein